MQRRPPQTACPVKILVNISPKEQQERYRFQKTISMAVLILYALMEHREEEVPATRG